LLKFHAISNLVQLGISRGKTTLDAQEVKDDFLPVLAALTSFKRRNPYAINLLPPEKRVEKSRWASVPVYVLLGINLIFLLALSLRKPVQQEIYSRQLQREVRRLEPEVKKIRQVETQIDTYQKRAELLTNFKKSTAVNLGAWNELSTLLPKNSWITNFALKDQSVEITGMSDEASKLLQILDSSPYFRKAEFTAPITRDGLGKEVFRIRMAIETLSPQPPPIAQASAAKEIK
jgi:general secretion pathway protein L